MDERPTASGSSDASHVAPAPESGAESNASSPPTEAALTQQELDAVLAAAGFDVSTAGETTGAAPSSEPEAGKPAGDVIFGAAAPAGVAAAVATQSYMPPEIDAGATRRWTNAQAGPIDLINDVALDVKVELGRARMRVDDVLKLGPGAVVELDKLAGDPVEVFVNERLIARGEVLVLNDDFCVRINEIVTPSPNGESAGERHGGRGAD